MLKLAELLSESESHTPATRAQRRQIREFSNPRRAALVLPPLEDDDNDEIPELEFFERARERGMLPLSLMPCSNDCTLVGR
jgi:hypothetical protein